MATKLLEAYKNRIAYAEKYANSTGNPMSQQKKVLLAKVLQNTDKFLTEAFSGTTGTQLSDMGQYKKFCLNLTNLAIPTLVTPEIVLVQPMSSISGYLVYVKYTAGTNKGGVNIGDTLNDPWSLGISGEGRTNYTSASVVQNFTGDGSETNFALGFTQGAELARVTVNGTVIPLDSDPAAVSIDADGNVVFAVAPANNAAIMVAYTYDNTSIPQDILPVYNAAMESIPLVAKARRIAIRYSQMAAYEAKNDYGFDIQQQLAAQAVGELSYVIDTEVVTELNKAAGDAVPELIWNINRPNAISKADHYEGFAEVLEAAKAVMFNRTKKFAPNYMVASSMVLRVLPFIKGWVPASVGTMNGPYVAGTLNGIKVVISPSLADGRFFLGVNQGDVFTSAAVYAPYMVITPTQLLGFADGSMTQGFSTLYDFKILNNALLIAGAITKDSAYAEGETVVGDVVTQIKLG